MRFFGRSLAALFLLALTAGLLGWAAQITLSAMEERAARDGGGPPARERVLAVNVVTATPQSVAPVMTAFGEIRARRVLELRAPVGGRVVELADGFEDGGGVTAGQVLLRIDPAGAEAALAVARADVSGAEAEARDAARGLELARAELDGAEAQRDLQAQAVQRQRDLGQRGVGAAAGLETAQLAQAASDQAVLTRRGAVATAEARIDSAALAIDRAAIAVAEAERDVADRTVTAAFAGQFGDVAVLQGGLVSPNERVATLLDPTALEVAFRLSAAQHARLLDGAGDLTGASIRAVLDVEGLNLVAQGRVTREAASVGDGQTGRQVFAALDGARGFRPGDFVRVEVEEPPLPGAIRLPAASLSAQGNVLILNEEDRLTEAPVELLRRQGDDILVAGDIAGQRVVAERTAALGAGIKVRAVAPGDAPEAVAVADETVTLDPDRRAKLVAYVQGNSRMPDDAKARILTQLEAEQVPVATVERLESRMGG